jgi:hypothetical protein
MQAKEQKVTKIKPYTKKWEKEADSLARGCIDIKPCQHCGHPVVKGYCCMICGTSEP